MRIAFFGSSLVSSYWNGAATYYRGIVRALHAIKGELPAGWERLTPTLALGPLKTKRSQRELELRPFAVATLRAHRARHMPIGAERDRGGREGFPGVVAALERLGAFPGPLSRSFTVSG